MGHKRVECFVGAAALLLSLSIDSADAQHIDNVTVSGEAQCGTAGPVGRYALHWTVVNPKVNGETTILSATESGAYDNEINYFAPNPVPGGQDATASDGPVPGTTKGTVTITVEYVTAGGVRAQSTGSIHLDGDCRVPDQG